MKKTKLTLLLLVVAMLVLTLCACQQTYDVTFALGYDNKTEVKTYDKGAKVEFSPTRTDYDFGGWFANYDLTRPWDFTAAVTHDMTLYAAWQPVAAVASPSPAVIVAIAVALLAAAVWGVSRLRKKQ